MTHAYTHREKETETERSRGVLEGYENARSRGGWVTVWGHLGYITRLFLGERRTWMKIFSLYYMTLAFSSKLFIWNLTRSHTAVQSDLLCPSGAFCGCDAVSEDSGTQKCGDLQSSSSSHLLHTDSSVRFYCCISVITTMKPRSTPFQHISLVLCVPSQPHPSLSSSLSHLSLSQEPPVCLTAGILSHWECSTDHVAFETRTPPSTHTHS